MHTWNAYFQINGYDFSRFPVIEFPVSDELFARIQSALSENRPLRDCPFHAELLRLAHAALDLDAYCPEYADIFPDLAGVSVASCTIDDPGDLKRLEAKLLGKRLREPELTIDDETGIRRFDIQLSLDDSGRISGVTSVSSEGLESESVSHSSWEACYPDYDFIAAYLQKLLR